MAIESYYNGSPYQVSTTSASSALGAPIMQYGYQNMYGPYGMQTNLGGGGNGYGSGGSGSSGPTDEGSAWYKGVLGGTNLPYSPFAKANLQSKAYGMNSAAETARNDAMASNAAASGASASDPSMQGAKLNSMARRQSDNANSTQDIESQANQANFSAQANAAAHLSQTQLAYDEMANSNAMRYSPFSGGGGGGGGYQPTRQPKKQNNIAFWQPVGDAGSSFWRGAAGSNRGSNSKGHDTGETPPQNRRN